MPEKLPKGWVKTTLGEITEPLRDRVLPTEATVLRYVGLEHIEPQTMRLLGYGKAGEVRSSSVRFSEGDVLYGKMRPYLNKVWIAEFDGICSAEFFVFPKREGLDNQFLAARLNAEDFVTFSNQQVSGERPRVDFVKLSSFTFWLPPTSEQKRIASKLRAVLSGVRKAESAALRAQEKLLRYRAAVFDAAVAGELTSVWRETRTKRSNDGIESGESLLRRLLVERRSRWENSELNRLKLAGTTPTDDKWKARYREPKPPTSKVTLELPATWGEATIDQLSKRVTVGHVGEMRNEYVPSGIPFLRSQNVRANRFDSEGLVFIRQEFHAKLAKSKISPGDVVVVRSGNVGTTCVIPESVGEANCSDLVLIQEPLVQPEFISFYMNSAAKSHVEMGKVGVAQTHFNTSSVASLSIPLPPVEEQAEIVREVERRLAAADLLAETLKEQLIRAEATRQSVLQEAFTGRLIAQNEDDEIASDLLVRLRASRESEAQNPKGRRMSKSRVKAKSAGRRSILTVLEENGGPMTPEQIFQAAGFEPSQVDQFYLELTLLREKLEEQKPNAADAKSWPSEEHVFLQLRKDR